MDYKAVVQKHFFGSTSRALLGPLAGFSVELSGIDCLDAAMQFQVTGQHWNTKQAIPCRTIWREQGRIVQSKCCLFN